MVDCPRFSKLFGESRGNPSVPENDRFLYVIASMGGPSFGTKQVRGGALNDAENGAFLAAINVQWEMGKWRK